MNLRGEKVTTRYHGMTRYDLPDGDQMTVLGDFWRVLRMRPTASGTRLAYPMMEYLPNNTYSYYKVKKTLMQVHGLNIKPTRYWNETCVKDVPDGVLYSLAEYCPGLPREANIVRDNEILGIPLYRIPESISFYDASEKKTDADVDATINMLLAYQVLPNTEQTPLEDLIVKVQKVVETYDHWVRQWPFLVANRLLKMQLTRMSHIKKALTERLDNHPWNSTNSASFNSNANPGNPPAAAGSSSQSGGTMDSQSHSANRSGYGNRGGRDY